MCKTASFDILIKPKRMRVEGSARFHFDAIPSSARKVCSLYNILTGCMQEVVMRASAIVVYKNMFHLALEAFVLLSGWKKNPIVLRSAIFLKKYLMRAFHLKSFPRTTYPPQKPTTNRNLLYTEKHSLNFLIHIFFPIINISYIILSIGTVAYYIHEM